MQGPVAGRSVTVSRNTPAIAYARLKVILDESKVRQTVRAQERFERKTDRRRRKRDEREWKAYMKVVKQRVDVAWNLKQR